MGRQPVRSAPGGGLRTCDPHPDLSFRLRPRGLAHRGASLSQTALTQMLYADMKVWLPENLLLKGDKMTMATAVELRVPFLDHKLLGDPQTVVPDEMKKLSKPVIGFFGLIADWVDLELIRFLAVARPGWNFALIGKITTDVRLFGDLPNVHLLGQKTYEALPGYVKAFDVAILPSVMNELTIAANPLKLREYLAAGLPVVSSAIPEAARLKHLVRIGPNNLEVLSHIDTILASGQTGPQIRISSQMDSESWDQKVEELSQIVAGVREAAA